MTPIRPIHTDIVLIGGGHAHVEVIRQFGMRPVPGVRLNLISAPVDTPYSGMLPGHLSGHYDFDDYTIDLQQLCRFACMRLIVDRATGLDRETQQVWLQDRPPVAYDLLSIDIGSTPDTSDIDGVDHAIPIKPIPEFLEKWSEVEQQAVTRQGDIDVVVVGAGVGGVEATLSLHYRLRKRLQDQRVLKTAPRFTILSRSKQAMVGHAPGARKRLLNALRRKGIRLIEGEAAVRIRNGSVAGHSGSDYLADAIILATSGRAASWLAGTGLEADNRGSIKVGETLQSVTDPKIFAAGDCAALLPVPLPQAGVYAVRQGPVLSENLRLVATGEVPVPFKPQRNILALISLGEQRAVASKNLFSAEGEWIWRWKDRIDRRWMARYDDDLPNTPIMASSSDAQTDMRCGGCGAKVPQAVLRSVLERLKADPETSAVLELDMVDDATEIQAPRRLSLFQTVDQFRSFVDDPFLFGQIAANHCLGDIYAMGGRPLSALATITLPHAEPVIVRRDLEQLLRGILAALRKADAFLVGGHTAEGAELTVGLTVNGTVERASPWRKGGMTPGDRLILNKPLGTGVVMAAEMTRRAKGRDVRTALTQMAVSNAAAVDLLWDHGTTACTDVTGFGLGGHLLEMLEASNCRAVLDGDVLPILPGAAALLAQGVASTLHPANAASIAPLCDGEAPAILADPQTSGGLLASVPAAHAEACVTALRSAGYDQATVIGMVQSVEDAKDRVGFTVQNQIGQTSGCRRATRS